MSTSPNILEWPDDAPVQPLGICGPYCFYRDVLGFNRMLHAGEHHSVGIERLFDGDDFLLDHFPTFNAEGQLVGWEEDRVTGALVGKAVDRGIIKPADYGFELLVTPGGDLDRRWWSPTGPYDRRCS